MIAAVVSPGAIPDFVHPPVPGESHDLYGDSHLDAIKLPPVAAIEPPRSRPDQSSDPLSLSHRELGILTSNSNNPLETGASPHEQNSGAAIVAEGERVQGAAGRTSTNLSDGSSSSSSSSDDTSWARLLEETISGNADRVQEILTLAPELKESIDNLSSATGMNPLHFAASRGHEEIARTLIDQAGAVVDIQDREGEVNMRR